MCPPNLLFRWCVRVRVRVERCAHARTARTGVSKGRVFQYRLFQNGVTERGREDFTRRKRRQVAKKRLRHSKTWYSIEGCIRMRVYIHACVGSRAPRIREEIMNWAWDVGATAENSQSALSMLCVTPASICRLVLHSCNSGFVATTSASLSTSATHSLEL